MLSKMRWEDWVGVALGAFLIGSPWLAGYSTHHLATLNAVIAGAVLLLAELLSLIGVPTIGDWIGVGVGLWLMASPFTFAFASQTVATGVTAGLGLLVLLFTAWAMSPADGEDEK
jgi:hypothetical protein